MTLIKANGSGTLSRHKELKIAEKPCRDKRKLCHDTALRGKITLSQQRSFMSQQTQHKVEVNSIATKKSIVVTKVDIDQAMAIKF